MTFNELPSKFKTESVGELEKQLTSAQAAGGNRLKIPSLCTRASHAYSSSSDEYAFVKPCLIVTNKTFGEGRVVKPLEDKRDKKTVIAFGKAKKMLIFSDAFKKGFLDLQWLIILTMA